MVEGCIGSRVVDEDVNTVERVADPRENGHARPFECEGLFAGGSRHRRGEFEVLRARDRLGEWGPYHPVTPETQTLITGRIVTYAIEPG